MVHLDIIRINFLSFLQHEGHIQVIRNMMSREKAGLSIFMLGIWLSLCSFQPAGPDVILPGKTISPQEYAGNIITTDHDVRSFSFILKNSEEAEYRFFLEGFDNDWTGWRSTGMKEYTNLPPGKYVFHSEMQTGDGIIKGMQPVYIHILYPWYLTRTAMAGGMLLFILFIWVTYEQLNLRFARRQHVLEQIINKRTEDLIIEKEKSEALLANVLPRNTATEIMAKGKAAKIKYNFVTVLFSDIQGFTKIAEEMNPEVLIDELDKFFFYFDSVVEKYGIEKIKTIGDAYMCAGGIPEKNRTNPVEVILAALEMKAYMTRLKDNPEVAGMKYWDIRIGVHTGTVVAGVVGQKKLSYDIWGDTVNTASRMESSGEAGKINISGTTYEFVKDFFTCEYRGKMPVKYKGELEMYFVKGIKEGLCDEKGLPNRQFMIRMLMIKLQDVEEIVLKTFDEEASPSLFFHNAALVKNVIGSTELLANAERVPGEELIGLRLAAMFLFTGYIFDYDSPAEASVRFASEILPGFGFHQDDINSTYGLIRNSFAGIINNLQDSILHDARYDYLGRVDYIRLTEKLYRELAENGKVVGREEWIGQQKNLLASHEFRTGTAKLIRSVTAERQIAELEKLRF